MNHCDHVQSFRDDLRFLCHSSKQSDTGEGDIVCIVHHYNIHCSLHIRSKLT